MRKFLLIALLSICAGTVCGQPAEKITLEDGSVLSGYIYKQIPGQDLIFFAEKAEICVPADCVFAMENREVGVETLSGEWSEWCSGHPCSVKNINDKKVVLLSSFIDRRADNARQVIRLGEHPRDIVASDRAADINVQSVRLLEKGDRFRYLDLQPAYYGIDFSAVVKIERTPRKNTELSGIIDVIETEAETFEGQIVGQIPGKYILLATEEGVTEVIANNRIVSQKRKPLNPHQSLFEQSRFVDVISGQNNAVYRGILVEQNYGNAKTPGFVVLQDREGKTHREERKYITALFKEPNNDYNPVYDVILGKGEIRINGTMTGLVAVEKLSLGRKAGKTYTKPEQVLAVVAPENVASVKAKEAKSVVLELSATDSDDFRMVALVEGKGKDGTLYETFTYEEYFDGKTAVNKTVSPNNTMRIEFEMPAPGLYVIYNQMDNIAAVCEIE